jgi:hypothetical protein
MSIPSADRLLRELLRQFYHFQAALKRIRITLVDLTHAVPARASSQFHVYVISRDGTQE